jgi:hypothetical protein
MRRELRSRGFDVFTMSFLDTICCAFGAVILLFMLSKFGEPAAQEKARVELEGRVAKLQEEREEIPAPARYCSVSSPRVGASSPMSSARSRGCGVT